LLPLGTTGIGVWVGSPDLGNKEQAMVAVSSKVVTGGSNSPCQRGMEHYRQCSMQGQLAVTTG